MAILTKIFSSNIFTSVLIVIVLGLSFMLSQSKSSLNLKIAENATQAQSIEQLKVTINENNDALLELQEEYRKNEDLVQAINAERIKHKLKIEQLKKDLNDVQVQDECADQPVDPNLLEWMRSSTRAASNS